MTHSVVHSIITSESMPTPTVPAIAVTSRLRLATLDDSCLSESSVLLNEDSAYEIKLLSVQTFKLHCISYCVMHYRSHIVQTSNNIQTILSLERKLGGQIFLKMLFS